RQSAQHHSVIAEERFHPSDGFRLCVIEFIRITIFHDSRNWKKRLELFRAAAWATAGATTTMRSRKSFVQIQMDYVDAHIARSCDTNKRVHVCAIHIDEPTCVMNDLTYLLDVSFEQTERVRICKHQSRDVTVCAKFA